MVFTTLGTRPPILKASLLQFYEQTQRTTKDFAANLAIHFPSFNFVFQNSLFSANNLSKASAMHLIKGTLPHAS